MHLYNSDFNLSERIKTVCMHKKGTINDNRNMVWNHCASTAAVLLAGWRGKHLLLTSVKPETSPFANGLLMDGVHTLASDTGRPFIKCFPDS